MGGGAHCTPQFLFVKTIEKVIRLCTVLIFFLIGSFEDRAIFHHFSRIYLSICNGHIRPPPIITKLRNVKNGPIFKTTTQRFFSTQCIILLLFLLFSQIKIGGGAHKAPPHHN